MISAVIFLAVLFGLMFSSLLLPKNLYPKPRTGLWRRCRS